MVCDQRLGDATLPARVHGGLFGGAKWASECPNGRIVGWTLGERYCFLLEPAEGESRAPALWEYLPGTSTWQRRADFAGELRRDGLSFAANGLGYYGAGQNLASVRGLKDIWEYNSIADRWLRFTDLFWHGQHSHGGPSPWGRAHTWA